MPENSIIISIVVAFVVVMIASAYATGALDPAIEKFGIMFFKAKAKAEEKKMEAEGKKEGEDFLRSELKGNKQASDVAKGMGSVGDLKVEF